MKGADYMGMHTLDDLMLKWQHEKLTVEQVIGQLLQHIGVLYERLRLVERTLNVERRAREQGAQPPTTAATSK
jgi:arabinogalactan endo-1,4-beta-galactosidase